MSRIISEELFDKILNGGMTEELWKEYRSAPVASGVDLSGVKSALEKFTHLYGVVAPKDIDAFLGFMNAHLAPITTPAPAGQAGEDFGDRQLLEDIVNLSQLVLNDPIIRLPEDICDRIRARPTNDELALRQPVDTVVENDLMKKMVAGYNEVRDGCTCKRCQEALRTQPQACGSQNAICETQEGLASMRETQPQAHVKTIAYIGKEGERRRVMDEIATQPQTPVVEITEEEIEMTMKMASKRGEQEPRVVKAIHALLQSKGGR